MGNKKSCGKRINNKRDCPIMKPQGTKNAQTQVGSPNTEAPKNNNFYSFSL